MDLTSPIDLQRLFGDYGERLLFVIKRNLSPALSARFSPEDVLQEAYLSATQRTDFFTARPDVPSYFKLRTIILQTIIDLERRHLQYEKRSALKEVSGEAATVALGTTPDEAPSPRTLLARKERNTLLKHVMDELSESDHQILVLRHFDGMGNAECAAALNITQKAASIRYVRALQRLHERLLAYSEFRA